MSGNWKDICKTKELLKPGYSSGIWLAHLKGYNVSSGYEWLRRREQKVGWAKLAWDNLCMRKHSFLTWLVFRNALPLKDRLLRFGISQDDQCCICHNATETMVHLFQNCRFAVAILTKVADRLHIPMPAGNAVIWVGRRHWTRGKKDVCLFTIMAVWYNIWQQRNQARLEGLIAHLDYVVEQVFRLLKIRLTQCTSLFNPNDLVWISSLACN